MKLLIKKCLILLILVASIVITNFSGAIKTQATTIVTRPTSSLNGLAGLVAVNNLTSPYRYGGYYGAPTYGGYYGAPAYGGYSTAPYGGYYAAPAYGGYATTPYYGGYVTRPYYGGYGYGGYNSLGGLIVLNSLFGR